MRPSKNFLSLCLMITLISFLGFLTENIWLSITKGYMNNRNMYFPFLLGYGLAVILFYALFGTPQTPKFINVSLKFSKPLYASFYYMLMVALCISIGETLIGNIVEYACGFEWWNYTWLPFNIGKYTSLPTSFAFSSFITLFMRFYFNPLHKFFCSLNYNVLWATALFFMLLMVGDFIHSGYLMFKNKAVLIKWQINTSGTILYQLLHLKPV